jgi:hypothetical protein
MAGLIMSETQQLTTGNKTWHSDDEVTRRKKRVGKEMVRINFFFIFELSFYVILIRLNRIDIFLKDLFYLQKIYRG